MQAEKGDATMSGSSKFAYRARTNVMIQMELQHHHNKYRPYLLAIAYNMLGQIQEAEDIVHDLFEGLLDALSAWRESPLFSEEERALLAMTEEVTRLGEHGVSDETYEHLKAVFDETTIAHRLCRWSS